MRKVHRRQVESFLGDGPQMLALKIHSHADRLRSPGNDPLLIFPGSFEQEIVEFFPAAGLRHGHQVVPAEVAAFPFHTALFVPLSRCAKLCRETQ